jgi:hypothetical protein
MSSRWITARYSSPCSHCTSQIKVDDVFYRHTPRGQRLSLCQECGPLVEEHPVPKNLNPLRPWESL